MNFALPLRALRETLFALLFLLTTLSSYSQETQSWAKENIQFSGYVKYLNTTSFQDLDATINDNLLHNRLNLKVYLNTKFTTTLEVRNRIFWGNSIQFIPNYADLITSHQDIDMSFNLIDKPALLFHSKIDRLNIDYQSEKWQITLGRQRINWGKNLVWNPNDLFNTYSFFDFDYEERPGADALRIQYFTSGNSSIETAINYTDKWDDNTLALKYNFNQFNYDFQFLLAKYSTDYTFGLGWEGAIKDVGIKGEFSYFMPQEKTTDSENALVGSLSFDYYFKNGISINLAGLYNSLGISEVTDFSPTQFNSFQLSAKNMMPNRLSYFTQISKPISPALNLSFSTIYAQELQGVFMMPQMTYNLAQNWDFDTTAQVFYGKNQNEFSNMGNSIYLRFRWSF